MRSPVMIRMKPPRRWSRALIFCLTIFLSLSLVSGPAWAAVGVNPPAGNPDDYIGGNWDGTADADDYTNDGTVSGNVLMAAGDDEFTNNGYVNGTIRGNNGQDQFTNNVGGQINGTMRGDNGNDTLINHGTIGNNLNGGNGDDTIQNHGTVNNILGGNGQDTITNYGTVASVIYGESGHDTIDNRGNTGWIFGDDGDDQITNNGSVDSTIYGGTGHDIIDNRGTTQWISGDDGDDQITNNGTVTKSIHGGADKDTIINNGRIDFGGAAINAGPGNDTITNNYPIAGGILGEEGNDTITNNSSVGNTINGGSGDDTITINGSVSGNVNGGDGMDYIVVSGRVDGDIQGNADGDTVKLTAGASVGGVIRGGAAGDAVIFEGVADVSAFNIVGFSYFSYTGTNGLSGTYSAPSADLNVHGTLRLQNGTINAQSLDVWPAGAVLTGNGNIACPLSIHLEGSVAPGNSIGTISADSLEILWDSSYNAEMSGAAADQLIIANSVILTSAILKLSILSPPVTGRRYTIIRNDGAGAVLGTLFSGLPEGANFQRGGYLFSITYQGGDGNDVVLTCLGPVPSGDTEPEPEPTGPDAPSVTTGSGPSPAGSLDGSMLSWPHVDGAIYYRIYRADCPLCQRKEIGRVADNSFVDNTAIPGQPYAYWLRSENSDGLGVYSNWMAAWRYEQNPGRAGDFNGDGVMDLLWWDPATNQLSIWFMNGGAVQSVSEPGEALDSAEWLLIALADFNGDGACDLLWWKPETGETRVWYLDMAKTVASGAGEWLVGSAVDLEAMSGHALLAYTGDVNGDGRADIFWRDYSNGDVRLWIMGADGKPQLSGPPTPADETITSGGRPGISGALQWQVAGLGDANADGKADVIWKDERNNKLVTWLMDGSEIIQAIEENKGLDTVWRLAGLGDLNADQQVDVVWRNESSGAVQAWLMQAGGFSEERAIIEGSGEAAQWQVKAMGDFCSPGCDDLYCRHSESGAAKIVTLDGREFTPSMP